ncbi:hypothetical protein [Effusibacillus lacus]|nr:hypothetical protein [Effusibacillus lacus]TCS75845.1 hypothetical protein EDD64_10527 [Effusibacillus lacus]
MVAKYRIRECLQHCEGIYNDIQTAMDQVHDHMAKQRLESAMTDMEVCINDCRSALDNV